MEKALILQKARDYVRAELTDERTGHDWWHIHRVTEWARKIAVEEGADAFICEAAALFHDLADEKVVGSKEEGLRQIGTWLEEHQVERSSTEHILDIIAAISYRGGNGKPMKTLEGKVVQDADRLDSIGAIGIARTFVYAGSKGHLIYDPEMKARASMTEEQYRNEKNTAINHFYEKLLKLSALMNTETGKRLAKERHEFMERYLEQFYAEWNV